MYFSFFYYLLLPWYVLHCCLDMSFIFSNVPLNSLWYLLYFWVFPLVIALEIMTKLLDYESLICIVANLITYYISVFLFGLLFSSLFCTIICIKWKFHIAYVHQRRLLVIIFCHVIWIQSKQHKYIVIIFHIYLHHCLYALSLFLHVH